MKTHASFDPKSKIWSSPDQESYLNPNIGLGPVILSILARTPKKVAQISVNNGVSFICGEMRLQSIRVAENLRKIGLTEGDFIAIAAKNHHQVASIVFGCFVIGTPIVFLDFAINSGDSSKFFQMTKPKLMICDELNLQEIKKAFSSGIGTPIIVLESESDKQLFSPVENEENFRPPKIKDPTSLIAAIICTSGTTGPSKGVKLSHSAILTYAPQRCPIEDDDVLFCSSTLYWIMGFASLIAGTIGGCTRLITTVTYNPPEMMEEMVNRYKVTKMITNNYNALRLVNHLKEKGSTLTSMRVYCVGATLVYKSLEESLRVCMPNAKVFVTYGISEACGVVAMVRGGYETEGELGELVDGVEAKISSSKMENLISQLEGVEFVSAIGIPDAYGYDAIAAVIVKKPGSGLKAQEVKDHVPGKFYA